MLHVWAGALVLAGAVGAWAGGPADCLVASGDAGARCFARYVATVADCRATADAACEAAVRAPAGTLDALTSATRAPIDRRCDEAASDALGYLGVADVRLRVAEACRDFGEDFLETAFSPRLAALSPRALRCQRIVALQLGRLRDVSVRAVGSACHARAYEGHACDRERRDATIARARMRVAQRISRKCGTDLDAIGLGVGTTREARLGDVLGRTVDRARHFAQRVYPPNDLGPTAEFGPYPVGVRTLDLLDRSRSNAAGDGPRPVKVEVYYPSTAAATAGASEDVVEVLGIDVVATPAFRDVARAPGRFPLVLFSHGNGGIRFQSFFFAAHLASHGYVVATPDHHGNTFVDSLLGIVDPTPETNRPRDLSFLIDRLLALDGQPGSPFEGAIDADRIGASGHSFGGYTVFAVAGGAFAAGSFTDPRIKAILPQAPATFPFSDAFFQTVTVPVLIVGGSIDGTTPFVPEQQRPFDRLPAGAAVVAVAELTGAGHFTFSDFCEVPRNLLAFLGGFAEACEPRHLAWRHAHDIVNYLSLNFFDAVLRGDAGALGRLAPPVVGRIEDVVYQRK